MTGLDTKVLVRYLSQDDPAQARKAVRAIEDTASKGEELFVADIVVCELVWVLETSYGYGRDEIAPVLEKILRTRQFCFEEKDLLWQAGADYRSGKGDLSDHLIGRTGKKVGCGSTLTFDGALKADPLFELL